MAGLAFDTAASQESTLVEQEEAGHRLEALRDALDVLNSRERRIFEARRLADDPMTLRPLSDEFGISCERVRQIDLQAFEKVRLTVKVRIANVGRDQFHKPGCTDNASLD